MADEVTENTITNNVNNGVLGFEYPNPYPPRECDAQEVKEAEEKGEGCTKTIYFQLSGDKIANNTLENNGTNGSSKFNSQILLEGGLFPHKKYTSDNNCVSGNTFVGSATTWPQEIEGTWGCQNATTPPPAARSGGAGIRGTALRRIGDLPPRPAAAGTGSAGNDAEPVRRRTGRPAVPVATAV